MVTLEANNWQKRMSIRDWDEVRKRGGMRKRWLTAKPTADCGKIARERALRKANSKSV